MTDELPVTETIPAMGPGPLESLVIRNPTYEYIGGTQRMGASGAEYIGLVACGDCGAMVPYRKNIVDLRPAHNAWHHSILELLNGHAAITGQLIEAQARTTGTLTAQNDTIKTILRMLE